MQNKTDTVYEADSAAKQFTSLVIGRAVTLGYLDLDTPIEKYGVTNHTNWGPWFSKLTARQLLGQVSGVGHYPPGEHFLSSMCSKSILSIALRAFRCTFKFTQAGTGIYFT